MISIALGWVEFRIKQLLGFVIMIIGTFIYIEAIVIPINFMKKNTKVELIKREAQVKSNSYSASRDVPSDINEDAPLNLGMN